MTAIYKLSGLSKQGFHQTLKREREFDERVTDLIHDADKIREEHPGCGVEKMYDILQPSWIGRDRFVDIFMGFGYRVRYQKNYQRTTYAGSSHYPNLIEGIILNNKNQLWQTDITYYRIGNKFYYLVFIIDVYTKVILGYQASRNMKKEANINALLMAMGNSGGNLSDLIHHSDRGSQFTSIEYLELQLESGIATSMGKSAMSNAYAERINGTIKNEYLKLWNINDYQTLVEKLHKAVNNYNHKRIHNSLPGKTTPKRFEQDLLILSGQKRPTEIVYAEGNRKIKEASSLHDLWPEKTLWYPVCPIV